MTKQLEALIAEMKAAAIAVAKDKRTDDEWFYYLQRVHHKNVLALIAALEQSQQTEETLKSRNRRLDGIISAAEKRIAELQKELSK